MRPERRLFSYPATKRDCVVKTLQAVLEARLDVFFAYVHGSFVTDRPFHDVDVAVTFDDSSTEPLGLRALDLGAEAEDVLSRALEGDAPPVDVRALNQAPLGFSYQALRGGRLLTSRDERLRTEWFVRVVTRYLDTKPLRERALKEAMTTWR